MTKLAKVFALTLLLSGQAFANDLPPVDQAATQEAEPVTIRTLKQDLNDDQEHRTDWAELAQEGYHMVEFVGKNDDYVASAKEAGLSVVENEEGFTVILDTDLKELAVQLV